MRYHYTPSEMHLRLVGPLLNDEDENEENEVVLTRTPYRPATRSDPEEGGDLEVLRVFPVCICGEPSMLDMYPYFTKKNEERLWYMLECEEERIRDFFTEQPDYDEHLKRCED